MTPIQFTVTVDFDAEPRLVWEEMIDWKGHERWIPSTRVEVPSDDAAAVGTEFTAWTGPGPLALEDRMRVSECRWDDRTNTGYCEVEKLGPVLQGRAGFTVRPHRRGDRGRVVRRRHGPGRPQVRPIGDRATVGRRLPIGDAPPGQDRQPLTNTSSKPPADVISPSAHQPLRPTALKVPPRS